MQGLKIRKEVKHIFIIIIACWHIGALHAQESPTEIRYAVMDIQALRFYPFTVSADTIIEQFLNRKANQLSEERYIQYNVYRKTTIDLVANEEYLNDKLQTFEAKNSFVYRNLIKPYRTWLDHTRLQSETSRHTALTTALFEDYLTHYADNSTNGKGSFLHASRHSNLFETIGTQNIARFLNDVFGDIDLFKNSNDVLFQTLRGSLSNNADHLYTYFLSGNRAENGSLYEIVFYPKNKTNVGFAGYLYITTDGNYSLKKAVFSLNNFHNTNFIQNVLITHTFDEANQSIPVKKRNTFIVGDDIEGCALVNATTYYSLPFPQSLSKDKLKNKRDPDYQSKDEAFWDNHRMESLTQSESQIENVIQTANQTQAFKNTENLAHFLMTDHLNIGGKNGLFEWGPITQSISYNKIEGLRLRAGGNTTLNLNKHFLLGGYAAYGLDDKQLKYRGDIIYSFHPKDKSIWEYRNSLLSFTYVKDLNIPGKDLLTSNRDFFFYSFSHASTQNLSLQKIGRITFEREMSNQSSFKIGGKYLYDNPMGAIQYKEIKNTELNFSFRYTPREKFFQNREKRIYLQRGSVELNFNHRVGIKGIFSSDYSYHATDFNAYKQFNLPHNVGTLNFFLSAGKIWNRIPYPLLFIPSGNQSYVFEQGNYNLMNYNEFVTDNFVAGNTNILFNWSPVKLFAPRNTIRTSLGARMIYGPLSDNNNPELHPELFAFNQGITPLGNTPYTEVNIGLTNIFKFFRIEYVRRLTYQDNQTIIGGHKAVKGSLLFGGKFSF